MTYGNVSVRGVDGGRGAYELNLSLPAGCDPHEEHAVVAACGVV
jgi:hypothetical protein